MNFKSILVVGLGVATLGLTAPAHAQNDNATVIDNKQEAVVTGDDNTVRQKIRNNTRSKAGNNENGSNGTAITNDQKADVFGNRNNVRQDIKNKSRSNQQPVR